MARKSCHPRVVLIAGDTTSNSGGTSFLKSPNQQLPFTATNGWPMYRSGSITAISASAPITAHSADGTVTMTVRANNSDVLSAVSDTVTASGGVEYFSATQASDTDRFVAGDFISVVQTITAATITTQDCIVLVELEYDD